MSRYYIDYQLRNDSMKEDKTDCWYPIVDSETFFHLVVAHVDTEQRANIIVGTLNDTV